MLLHSLFQSQGAVENVHVKNFCAAGAIGIGLCNVQDICFRSCKAENCYIGLQLNASTKSEAGDKGNFNTNLLFDNFIAQSCRLWSIACLPGQVGHFQHFIRARYQRKVEFVCYPGQGGADNVTFLGGVTQGKDSQAGGLVNVANIGTFPGQYIHTIFTNACFAYILTGLC